GRHLSGLEHQRDFFPLFEADVERRLGGQLLELNLAFCNVAAVAVEAELLEERRSCGGKVGLGSGDRGHGCEQKREAANGRPRSGNCRLSDIHGCTPAKGSPSVCRNWSQKTRFFARGFC